MKTLNAAISGIINSQDNNNNKEEKSIKKRCQGLNCVYYEIHKVLDIDGYKEEIKPYCLLAHKELEVNDKDSIYSCAPTNWVVACEECVPTTQY